MGVVILILVSVLLVSAVPKWGFSRQWGYAPSGILGILFVLLFILVLAGYLPRGC